MCLLDRLEIYDSRQPSGDFYFDFTHLDGQVYRSIEGMDHQKTLKGIVNDDSIQITVDSTENNNDWDIPQVNATEKNDPKINEPLGKAVNAAISIKSGKESMVKLEKKYERPENCNLLKVPHVKKKILDAIKKNRPIQMILIYELLKISGNWYDTFGANG